MACVCVCSFRLGTVCGRLEKGNERCDSARVASNSAHEVLFVAAPTLPAPRVADVDGTHDFGWKAPPRQLLIEQRPRPVDASLYKPARAEVAAVNRVVPDAKATGSGSLAGRASRTVDGECGSPAATRSPPVGRRLGSEQHRLAGTPGACFLFATVNHCQCKWRRLCFFFSTSLPVQVATTLFFLSTLKSAARPFWSRCDRRLHV